MKEAYQSKNIENYDKLIFLTCRNFGSFLIKVISELTFLFMVYLKTKVLPNILDFKGCETTSKVVRKKKNTK